MTKNLMMNHYNVTTATDNSFKHVIKKSERKHYRKERTSMHIQFHRTLSTAKQYLPLVIEKRIIDKLDLFASVTIGNTTFYTYKPLNIKPMTGHMKERKKAYKESIESSNINTYTLKDISDYIQHVESYDAFSHIETSTDSNDVEYPFLTGLEAYDPIVGYVLYKGRPTAPFRTSTHLRQSEMEDLRSEAVTITLELISEGKTLEFYEVEAEKRKDDKKAHQLFMNELSKRLSRYIDQQVFKTIDVTLSQLKKLENEKEKRERQNLSLFQLHLIDTFKIHYAGICDYYMDDTTQRINEAIETLTDKQQTYVHAVMQGKKVIHALKKAGYGNVGQSDKIAIRKALYNVIAR